MSNDLYLGRPADRSLEAFRAWVQHIGEVLHPGGFKDDLTPEEWESSWREFWAAADRGARQTEASDRA